MVARWCVMALLSVLFIGCATTGDFESSSHPDAATLTFFNKSAYPVRLGAFANGEDCSGGRLRFDDQKAIGFGKSTTVRIAPREKFSFYFHSTKPRLMYYCVLPATFVPRAGESYVATFDLINYSVHFESDAVIPGTDLGIPPTDASFGFAQYQEHNEGLLWGTTEVAPCYVSVARIENGGFVKEPTLVGRRWRRPVISNSESQCY